MFSETLSMVPTTRSSSFRLSGGGSGRRLTMTHRITPDTTTKVTPALASA
jgi:hypothetical protein